MIEPKSYLYKSLSLFLMLGFVFYSGSVLYAQRPEIRMPTGRIAISSDGNLHDSDDWGATAFSLAIISHAGLADRFVHYDYCNHLGESRASWEVIMTEAAKGGARRFGLDVSKVFDDQKQKAGAIANFVNEAKKNTAQDPLWLICAGPMQMAWEMINATPAEKRQNIHCISHGKWNEIHVHGECQKTWADMKKDFPTVSYHNIADQNKSNGENDFQSNISNWFWLRDSPNPNFKWLYNLDDTHFVDEQETWKSNTKEVFDVSDAGMTYWLVTGGPNGGNDKGGWMEAKALFENPVKIKTLECLEVDSVPADFPVSFSFLTSGEWQFIAYYNKNRNLTMASRKTTEPKWNYKILPTKVGWDSHNSITMAFDAEKCIHLTGNMHNDSLIYFKTEKPLDVLSLKKVFPQVLAEDELSCTYPNFVKNTDYKLIYSYRKGGSGNGITVSNIYDEKTRSFKRLTDKPLFDGLGEMSAYSSGTRLGPDKFFHTIWLWRDTPGCETNHDLSYARSRDLIHWETMNGTKLDLPITPRTTQFTVDPVPAKGGAINGGFSLFFDQDKKPLIAYLKYDSAGFSQIFVAKTVNGKWVVQQVSKWDYRWEFSGPGSFESEIRINRAGITPDGKIGIGYWHIKNGNGELILDKNTLNLLADRPVNLTEKPEFPDELLKSDSKLEGMSVRWIIVQQSKENPDEYYGLRWETMGKRRFYEPRDKPVPSSTMKLYKFRKE